MEWVRQLAQVLFPPACRVCRQAGTFPICQTCTAQFRLIGPPRCPTCGRPFRRDEHPGVSCAACRTRVPAFRLARAAGVYEGTLREAIHALKFGGCRAMAGPLGALIAASIQADPELQADTLVPVPLHPSRRRERGFNQAELLARQVARGRGLRCEAGLLRRRLPTASQSGLSRSARQANVRETFTASGRVHGRSILLVDDVISTGSTASACAQALLAAGAADVVVAVVAQAVLAR